MNNKRLTSHGVNRYLSPMGASPEIRSKYLGSLRDEIIAFANDRGIDPAIVQDCADKSLQKGRLVDLVMSGLDRDDQVALAAFISSAVLNMTKESKQKRSNLKEVAPMRVQFKLPSSMVEQFTKMAHTIKGVLAVDTSYDKDGVSFLDISMKEGYEDSVDRVEQYASQFGGESLGECEMCPVCVVENRLIESIVDYLADYGSSSVKDITTGLGLSGVSESFVEALGQAIRLGRIIENKPIGAGFSNEEVTYGVKKEKSLKESMRSTSKRSNDPYDPLNMVIGVSNFVDKSKPVISESRGPSRIRGIGIGSKGHPFLNLNG